MMGNTNPQDFAVLTLYEWFKDNKAEFIARNAELEFKDSGHGSAYVRLETKAYLAELSAWDHASCLDIQIIDIKLEENSYPHTGECESKRIFENHLKEFIKWFHSAE